MSLNEMNSASGDDSYNLMKEDAEALLGLVNKYVKIKLIRDTEFLGFVHSIDPVQHSIILLQPENNSHIVNIIPGHAIMAVTETLPIPDLKPLEQKKATPNSDDIIKKKQKLMSWFKKNLLQITESEQKILFGNICILPPYDVTSICTDNPLVAMQLRKIIGNMPEDFDSDV